MGKNKKNKNRLFNAFDLIGFMWDKKWILVSVSAIAFIVSVIVSLNITPRFKSAVVFFPAASVSLSKNLAETAVISVDSRDILSFGDQTESERMLQILNSGKIKDHIIRKFNLMEHYDIDPGSPYPLTQLNNKYKSNIRFRRTEFNSIEISVLDTDAQMAADIANDIAAYVDSVFHDIQLERAQEAFHIVENEYLASRDEVQSISDSLQKIRDMGVLDYESQVAALSNAYAEAIAQGNNSMADEINRQMNVLTRYGGTYVELSKKLDTEMERMDQLENLYDAYKINVTRTIPQVYIVDQAEKAERKAVPHRSMIVVISALSTFTITLLLLLILDYFKILK